MPDQETLLLAILEQIGVGQLDYERLAQAIGAPSKNAAQVRVSRLKTKLKNAGNGGEPSAGGPSTPSKPTGITKKKTPSSKTPRKKKGKKNADGDENAEQQEGNAEEVSAEVDVTGVGIVSDGNSGEVSKDEV